jgi:hypothetical protein
MRERGARELTARFSHVSLHRLILASYPSIPGVRTLAAEPAAEREEASWAYIPWGADTLSMVSSVASDYVGESFE